MKTIRPTIVLALFVSAGTGEPPASAGPANRPSEWRDFGPRENTPSGIGKSDWAGIREAHAFWQHRVAAVPGGWQARNPGQRWTTRFDGRGFLTEPRMGGWKWGLEFRSCGRGQNQRSDFAQPAVSINGQRIDYQWSPALKEWWVNDKRGLEHGFTIAERPTAAADSQELPLSILFAARGTLSPTLADDGTTVVFHDASETEVVRYGGLKVTDADGARLDSHFELGAADCLRLSISDREARYPITIDPIAQQAYVKIGGDSGIANAGDGFGTAVAIDGIRAVVGAPFEDSRAVGVNGMPDEDSTDQGAAYVFLREADGWHQEAFLKARSADGVGSGAWFGSAVSISGNTVVVGAPKADSAFVFNRGLQGWTAADRLRSGPGGQKFGASVSISNQTIVVGAPLEDSSSTGINGSQNSAAPDAGAAYVFVWTQNRWQRQAYLKPGSVGTTQAGDQFGSSVAISGDTVIVGAFGEDSDAAGVYPGDSLPYWTRVVRTGSSISTFISSDGRSWKAFGTPQSITMSTSSYSVGLVAMSSAEGTACTTTIDSLTITGTSPGATVSTTPVFGSIASTVPVSSSVENSGVYTLNAGGAGLAIAGGPDQACFVSFLVGNSANCTITARVVSISGGIATSKAGVTIRENATSSAAHGTMLTEAGGLVRSIHRSTSGAGAFSLSSLANENAIDSGAAYIFVRNGTTWSQQAYLKPPPLPAGSSAHDQFGYSVAISGDSVVIGRPFEDGRLFGINAFPEEGDGGIDSGAAYVFVRSGIVWSQQAYVKSATVGSSRSRDHFGHSVSISGDTMVIGAPEEDSASLGINSTPNDRAMGAGAAYIFVRAGGSWVQEAYVKPAAMGRTSSDELGDLFGYSVAVSGTTVIIGANREDSSEHPPEPSPNEGAKDSGAAYVYERGDTTWSERAFLKTTANSGPSNWGDAFGYAVGTSGDTVVVGAPSEGSASTGIDSTPDESAPDSGAVYVFVREGTGWIQQAYLKPADPGAWQEGDFFGSSVAISGDTIVVGAPYEGSGSTGVNGVPDETSVASGAAYVFVRNGGVWSQEAYLKPAAVGSTQNFDNFGNSVAISDETIAVGAPREDGATPGSPGVIDEAATDAGAAYIFVRTGTNWHQEAYLKPTTIGSKQSGDLFGSSVSISGGTVVVGAPWENGGATGVDSVADEGAQGAGAAYVFGRNGAVWTQQAYLKPAVIGTTQAFDGFGSAVAISGDAIVVGAPREDSSGTGVNSAPNESAPGSGAAYVFSRLAGVWSQAAFLKPAAVGTTQAGDEFGTSVAISGDTIVVGSPGEDSNALGINPAVNDSAVDPGAAFVFVRVGSQWGEQAFLKPAAVGNSSYSDRFGSAVAVSGDTVVVGAPYEASGTMGINTVADERADTSGAAYIFAGAGPAGLSSRQLWRQSHFGTMANVGHAADAADPDGDGVVNLFEWACRFDPTVPSPFSLEAKPDPKAFEYLYPRSVDALNAGTVFTVEWSNTLSGSTWSHSGVTEEILSDDGSVQHVKALIPMDGSPIRFVRLKVLGPP